MIATVVGSGASVTASRKSSYGVTSGGSRGARRTLTYVKRGRLVETALADVPEGCADRAGLGALESVVRLEARNDAGAN